MSAGQIILAASALGGLIGGMGMGGGTLLIPLLTLCAGLEQHLAQAVNLLSFIPMSLVALLIHGSNGYVDVKKAAPIAAVALLGGVGGSFLMSYASGFVLKALFGAFLAVLGVISAVSAIRAAVERKREEETDKSAYYNL